MCRGIDARPLALVPVRKSIGAGVNYGIRFEDMPAAEDFLQKVCVEVAQRLQKVGPPIIVRVISYTSIGKISWKACNVKINEAPPRSFT